MRVVWRSFGNCSGEVLGGEIVLVLFWFYFGAVWGVVWELFYGRFENRLGFVRGSFGGRFRFWDCLRYREP